MDFAFDPPTRSGADWRPGLVGGVFADRGLCGRFDDRGLLRFHDAESALPAQATITAMFGTWGLTAEVFAFDWLARQFAVTTQLAVEGTPDHTGDAADCPRSLRRLDHTVAGCAVLRGGAQRSARAGVPAAQPVRRVVELRGG
ncbi:hypothetical protein GCM10023147_45960 [Tsukamurella soli]|uniref:Uncharacterized protein n=1 Tax=Tsukamurella soli TaxID=644556 RepID=A0ABP8KD09_9ACTN